MNSANLSVRKSNRLIEVGENLSKSAKLLVLYLIAITPDDETELRSLTVDFDELKRIINIDGKKRISSLKEAERVMDELGQNPLKFENAEVRDTITWFSKMRYYKKKKTWQFKFHEELKPYLLELREHFTRYNFWYTLFLTADAIKFYELMKRYEYLGTVELPLERQKFFLGIEGKYEEYYEYRRWVLDKCQKQLEQYTDIKVNYEPSKKKGKRILSHRFTIEKNKPKIVPKPLLESQKQQRIPFLEESSPTEIGVGESSKSVAIPAELLEALINWGGKKTMIEEMAEVYGIEKMEYQHRHTKRVAEDGKLKGKPFGWFRSALKGNYADPMQEEKRKVVLHKKKVAKEKNVLAEMVRERSNLLNTFIQERNAICDEMVEGDANLLNIAFEALKQKSFILFSIEVQNAPEKVDYSPAQWYEQSTQRGAFNRAFQEMYPAKFAKLIGAYKPQIIAIERAIRKAGGSFSKFDWGKQGS